MSDKDWQDLLAYQGAFFGRQPNVIVCRPGEEEEIVRMLELEPTSAVAPDTQENV